MLSSCNFQMMNSLGFLVLVVRKKIGVLCGLQLAPSLEDLAESCPHWFRWDFQAFYLWLFFSFSLSIFLSNGLILKPLTHTHEIEIDVYVIQPFDSLFFSFSFSVSISRVCECVCENFSPLGSHLLKTKKEKEEEKEERRRSSFLSYHHHFLNVF